MRLSKTSRWILVIAMLPVAIVLVYLLFPFGRTGPRTPPAFVSLAFAGYTNGPFSNLLAQFVVSNVSNFDVRTPPGFGGFVYNFMTNGSWPKEHVRATSSLPQQVLRKHEYVILTVPIPTNNAPWRLRAGSERLPNGFERIGLTLRRVFPSGLQFIPDRILYVRDNYTGWTAAYSGAIEPIGNVQTEEAGDETEAVRSEPD